MLRCGQDNCQHFRSWADPKADCCVYAFQLPQLIPREPETRKSAPEEQAVATRKEKIGKRVDEKKKKMLRREHRPGKDNRRKGKTIKGVSEKNKEMPKKEPKHGIDERRKGKTRNWRKEKKRRLKKDKQDKAVERKRKTSNINEKKKKRGQDQRAKKNTEQRNNKNNKRKSKNNNKRNTDTETSVEVAQNQVQVPDPEDVDSKVELNQRDQNITIIVGTELAILTRWHMKSEVEGKNLRLLFIFENLNADTAVTRNTTQISPASDTNEPEAEECPDEWIMILEGAPPTGTTVSKDKVLLPKMCNFTFPASGMSVLSKSNEATVYFKKVDESGFRLNRTILIDYTPPTFSNPKCLWDCKWKDNPFFRKTVFWRYGGWGNTSTPIPDICRDTDIEKCVQVYLSLPKIPEDLLCLSDCFTNVVSEIERNDEDSLKCSDNNLIKDGRGTSFDENIDCLVHFARSEPLKRNERDPNRNRNNIRSDQFVEAQANRLTRQEEAQRSRRRNRKRNKRDVGGGSAETRLVDVDDFHKLVPLDPLGIAIVICIMANLDKQERLPDLRFPKDEFYKGVPIWNEKDCTDADTESFLPTFFEEREEGGKGTSSKGRKSNTKLFGPGSSSVQR